MIKPRMVDKVSKKLQELVLQVVSGSTETLPKHEGTFFSACDRSHSEITEVIQTSTAELVKPSSKITAPKATVFATLVNTKISGVRLSTADFVKIHMHSNLIIVEPTLVIVPRVPEVAQWVPATAESAVAGESSIV